MYLEISARRSGKTFRLIQHVRKNIEIGKKSLVIYPTYAMAHAVLPKDFFSNSLVEVRSLDYIGSSWFDNRKYYDYQKVFDEFDYVSEYSIPLTHDGYYVCTPRFLRTFQDWTDWYNFKKQDNLLSLIKMNDYHYKAYVCKDMIDMPKSKHFNKDFGNQIFNKEGAAG